MEKLAVLEKKLDGQLAAYPAMLQAERQSGIRKTHLVVLAALLVVLAVANFTFLPGILPAAIGLAYPLMATARAADGHDKAEDIQWLAYWLAYGLIILAETALRGLPARYIPLYPLVRLAALVYLYAPQTRGAIVLWQRALRPALHGLEAVSGCPALSKSASGSSKGAAFGAGSSPFGGGGNSNGRGGRHHHNERKRAEVARTLSEMRSRSGSEPEDNNEGLID